MLVFLLYINRSTGQVITTWAGTGLGAYNGDNISALNANILDPSFLSFNNNRELFVSQSLAHRIRKIDLNNIITTICGNGVPGFSGDSGLASIAKINVPEGICFDINGNLFFSDHANHRVRKVDVTTGIITTIAGTGVAGYNGDTILAINAMLNTPSAICIDSFGNLYIADYFNRRVRKINSSGIITTVAGNGTQGSSGDGGLALNAQFDNWGLGLAINSLGDLYISDGGRIRMINTFGIINTVAGNNLSYTYNGDSILAINANMQPTFIAFNQANRLFFTDHYNNRIRYIDSLGLIHTIAGNGISSYGGDNGFATAAAIGNPGGIVFDLCGNLYICEIDNPRIRKVWFNTDTVPQVNVAITPNDTVITGTTVTTTAIVNTGTVTGYQWIKNGVNAGNNSTYTYTPVNGDSVYCIVTVRACTGRMYTDTTTAIHLTVTGDAGVAVTTNLTIQTYPNPVTDVLHVATTEPKHYVLHNLMGITLLQGSVDKQNSIDMKAMPSGIYLLQLTDNKGQREVVRVVKE